jgi:hypothetical protein
MNRQFHDDTHPMIVAFLSPYPSHLYRSDDEDGSECRSLGELQASLSRSPPTSVSTPGKLRPAGYNQSGKFLPAKWIPNKTDKRAGK